MSSFDIKNASRKLKTSYWFLVCLTPIVRFYWDWKVSEMLADYHAKKQEVKNETEMSKM